MSAEERLAAKLSELRILLPPAPDPKGVYRPIVIVDKLVYTSGHLPVRPSGDLVIGRLGADLDVNAGCEAARLVGLGILASLRKQFGTLDRIRRVVKVLGVVNSTPEFAHQPAVINGCSELFAQIFGADAGVAPARQSRPLPCPSAWPWKSRPFSNWKRDRYKSPPPARPTPFKCPTSLSVCSRTRDPSISSREIEAFSNRKGCRWAGISRSDLKAAARIAPWLTTSTRA